MPLISSGTASEELPGIFLNIRTGRTTQSCPGIHKILHGHCHCGQVHQGLSQPERDFNEAETVCQSDISLAEEPNLFFAPFEVESLEAVTSHLVNPREAAEPGGIVKWVLKDYADQLAATSGFSTRLFASPLSYHA